MIILFQRKLTVIILTLIHKKIIKKNKKNCECMCVCVFTIKCIIKCIQNKAKHTSNVYDVDMKRCAE